MWPVTVRSLHPTRSAGAPRSSGATRSAGASLSPRPAGSPGSARSAGRARLTRAALVCALAVPAWPGYASERLPCPSAGQFQSVDSRWMSIRRPEFADEEGRALIKAWAAPAYAPQRMFVTNGRVVKRSGDSGCTWGTIYPEPGPLGNPGKPAGLGNDQLAAFRVVDLLHVPASPEGNKVLWVIGHDVVDSRWYRPVLSVTTNSGDEDVTFEDRTAGLPAEGRPIAFATDPNTPDTAYVLLRHAAAPSDTGVETEHAVKLYAHDAASKTWTLRSGGPTENRLLAGIAVDSFGVVHAWYGNRYQRSADAGQTFSEPVPFGAGVASVVTSNVAGRPVVAVFYGTGAADSPGGLAVSVDNGKAFLPHVALPAEPVAGTYGVFDGLAAFATGDAVWGFDLGTRQWVKVRPTGASGLTGLSFGYDAGPPVLYTHNAEYIYRTRLFPPAFFLPYRGGPGPGPGPTGEPLPPTAPPVTLTGSATEVTVAPGQTARVSYDIALGPTSTPADVYFVVDTTNSMSGAIRGLQGGLNEIVTALSAGGADVRFGAGKFADYGNAEGAIDKLEPGGVSLVYRRLCAIRSPGIDLSRCIGSLDALSQGGDAPEAQTVALYEAALGKGDLPHVAPGQQPLYRENSAKIAILITDTAFHVPGDGTAKADQFDYHSIDETAEALRSQDIHLVGVIARDGNTSYQNGLVYEQMRELISKVGTVAPRGGIDCDGDGKSDVLEGEPLFCEIDNTTSAATGVVPAVVGLVRGIEDVRPVCVGAEDPHRVVRDAQLPCEDTNLKLGARLRGWADFTCRPAQDGQDLPVRVRATALGHRAAVVSTVVRCRGVAVPPEVPPDVPPLDEDDPVVPVIFLPPSVPAPPNPPPQANPPNLNPNAGAAQQEDEQFQVATVGQGHSEQQDDEATELAMSAVDRKDPSVVPLFLSSAVLSALAAGAMYRRRVQPAVALRRVAGPR